jgi:hypothetical protein
MTRRRARTHGLSRREWIQGVALSAAVLLAAAGCAKDVGIALQQLTEARRLCADMLAGFLRSSEASSRAVMAGADQLSASYAQEASSSAEFVQTATAELRPLLDALNYSHERRIVEEFASRFSEYRALDQQILELAVENTNLKAQRLSFGPAREAADGFSVALESLVASLGTVEACRAEALSAKAIAALRGLQALQAPHIAEPEDAEMTRLEQEMSAMEAAIRSALDELSGLLPREAASKLDPARSALESFLTVHAEILALSRRNTNVHSLALTMGQKRTLAASCEERLRELQSALAKRELGSKR